MGKPPAAAVLARIGGRRLVVFGAAVPLFAVCLVIGLFGTFHYLRNYQRYRGFPPPRDPAFIRERGTAQKISVESAAIGGRRQAVYVFLPPGYATHVRRRYPVFYLLHGFPGQPKGAFLWTAAVGVDEDVLVAKRAVQPAITVMPYGSTGFFTDKEWANGIHRNNGWETFVARDVVRAIDARYRTIPAGADRALGGLSEGGYGALNIGLHHPGEFAVIESWSGYVLADDVKSVFGGNQRLLRWNSPLLILPQVARYLRKSHTYIWMYTGTDDKYRPTDAAFAAELARARVAHRYLVFRGGHDWALWRAQTPHALEVASNHLAHG